MSYYATIQDIPGSIISYYATIYENINYNNKHLRSFYSFSTPETEGKRNPLWMSECQL